MPLRRRALRAMALADLVLVTRAAEFAALRHSSQRRKGEGQEPYINHLAHVARLLAEAGADAQLVAAGYLHDCIEDQGITHAELAAAFGRDVADLVLLVTDDTSLPKAERKRLQIEHAPRLPARAQMLKIADKISNLEALLVSPPAGWSRERKIEYFEWARRVVDGCRGAHAALERQFDALHARRGEVI